MPAPLLLACLLAVALRDALGMLDARTYLPRAEKRLPRAEKRLPRAKKRLPRAKKRLPRAKKRLPCAKLDEPKGSTLRSLLGFSEAQ